MYAIEKNVPIPTPPRAASRSELFTTLAALEVGDSFLIHEARNSIVYTHGREQGRRYSVRRVSGTAWRVWRVS